MVLNFRYKSLHRKYTYVDIYTYVSLLSRIKQNFEAQDYQFNVDVIRAILKTGKKILLLILNIVEVFKKALVYIPLENPQCEENRLLNFANYSFVSSFNVVTPSNIV